MRENLQRLGKLVRDAHKAPMLARAGLAMQAVDVAAALLAQLVERAEDAERKLKRAERRADELSAALEAARLEASLSGEGLE